MEQKKRAPTAGTRHGNGAGWGGPAKGFPPQSPRNCFQPGNPGKWPMTEKRRLRKEQAEEVLDRLLKVAMGEVPAQVVQVQAMQAFTNRVLGTPRQTVDSTVKGKMTLEQLVRGSMGAPPPAEEEEGE
jgi:hypothetical protein